MNIVMVHLVHGAKVAINEKEAQADEENGWMRYNPSTPEPSDAAPAEPVKRKYARRESVATDGE